MRWRTDGKVNWLYREFLLIGIHAMKVSTKATFVTASTVAAFLLLLFKGEIATGTMMSGDVMRSAGTSGTGWFLISCLIFIALAVTIFSTIFWEKRRDRRAVPQRPQRVVQRS